MVERPVKTGVGIACVFLAIFVGACAPADLFPYVPPDADNRFENSSPDRTTLFGRPNNKTGLGEDCCTPTCVFADGEAWKAPLYGKEDMQALYSDWEVLEPWPIFQGDTLGELLGQKPDNNVFCAVLPRPDAREDEGDAMPYDLMEYASEEDAAADGAMITHKGACGACSSLKNLAIYIANPDLTEPVRKCSLTGFFDRDLSRLACIASLGFDLPCAQAWEVTTRRTAEVCATVCGRQTLEKTSHNKEYRCLDEPILFDELDLLNDCLACDEVFSGDLFKVAAGRSRRASGLPSAICRPCNDKVYPVEHYYPVPEP